MGWASCVGLGVGSWFKVGEVVPVLAPLRRPSLPCSPLAFHGEPSPALVPPLCFEGRFDAPLVV